ncbi:hypothetical protein DFH28DRAFT_984979 [Melampsora americana]|nr:hypothetical protein DFH28DRAFT_984979 [Melampsora americana]
MRLGSPFLLLLLLLLYLMLLMLLMLMMMMMMMMNVFLIGSLFLIWIVFDFLLFDFLLDSSFDGLLMHFGLMMMKVDQIDLMNQIQ